MTTDSAHPGDDPRRLLASTRELARGVHRAQRATWFPLLVLAAVTFASISAYYGHYTLTCKAVPPAGRVCTVYSTAAFVYWPIALVLAYVAIAAFYIHRSRARGVGTRVRPYVIAGIIIAVALTCASLWAVQHPPGGGFAVLWLHGPQSLGLFYRLASPAGALGLALLVLARAGRNRALLVFTLGYPGIVLGAITFRWGIPPSPWYLLPRPVIPGSVL